MTFLFFSFVGLAGYYGFVYLPLQEKKKEKWKEEVKKKLARSEKHLENKRYLFALGTMQKIEKKSKNLTRETAKKWINLSVQAFHALGLHVNVIDLFMCHEHLGLSHPHTAILAAESAIYEKKYDVFYRIHSLWEEREEPHLWQLLKSQALIYKGLVENGMSLLTNTCFLDPKIEARRHALLSDGFLAIGDIQRAKKSLHQSIQLDRKKAEYYRKKALLETREKNWEEAEKSLQEAIKVAPTVPQHYQNLANFYMRQGEYQKSAKIWRWATSTFGLSDLQLKTLFVNRVISRGSSLPKINKGYLQAINGYIHNLAENQFWNDQIYKTLAGNRHHKMFTQEVFWLRLLELLRLGKDQEAKDWIYLHSNDEQSWHLELEVQIWRVVQYRLQGQWVNDTTPVVSLDDTAMHYDSTFDEERKRHPFFTQLNDIIAQRMEGKQIDIAEYMQKLLDSEQVFSALFFAAGWKEAAPRLSLDHQQTQGFPLWYQDALQQLHQEDPKG